MPKRVLSVFFATFFVLVFSLFINVQSTRSDELDDINKQISELKNSLNLSIAATKPLESQLTALTKQISATKNKVILLENDMRVKKKNIDDGYINLAKKEELLSMTIRNYYVKSYYNTPLLIFFSGETASQITQTLAYQKAKTNQDKTVITNIALSIIDLEAKKAILEDEQKRLITTTASLDEQSAKLDEIV